MNTTTVSIADVMIASAALLFPMIAIAITAGVAEIAERMSK
jgi:hypothetical protein